jgi:hypothetical protein
MRKGNDYGLDRKQTQSKKKKEKKRRKKPTEGKRRTKHASISLVPSHRMPLGEN